MWRSGVAPVTGVTSRCDATASCRPSGWRWRPGCPGDADPVGVGLGDPAVSVLAVDGSVAGVPPAVAAGEPPSTGPVGEAVPLGTGVAPAVAAPVPVGDPVGAPGVGDAVAVSPASGPCSFSMTARICCSYAVSRSLISVSGTEAMCVAEVGDLLPQRVELLGCRASLSGPSRVTNSWVASA